MPFWGCLLVLSEGVTSFVRAGAHSKDGSVERMSVTLNTVLGVFTFHTLVTTSRAFTIGLEIESGGAGLAPFCFTIKAGITVFDIAGSCADSVNLAIVLSTDTFIQRIQFFIKQTLFNTNTFSFHRLSFTFSTTCISTGVYNITIRSMVSSSSAVTSTISSKSNWSSQFTVSLIGAYETSN